MEFLCPLVLFEGWQRPSWIFLKTADSWLTSLECSDAANRVSCGAGRVGIPAGSFRYPLRRWSWRTAAVKGCSWVASSSFPIEGSGLGDVEESLAEL